MAKNQSPIADWSEAEITQQLSRLRDKTPSMVPHFIDAVVERFVVRQDDRTAQVRLQFLRSQVEQLKLAKEFQQTMDDLDLLSYEKAKRIKTLQLETEELDSKRESRGELERLASLKKRKEMELEIAKLDQQIDNVKNAPKGEPRLSPEEQKAKRHAESEARIENLKKEKQKALKIEDEDERVLKVNAIDDAIQKEMVEWSRTLP